MSRLLTLILSLAVFCLFLAGFLHPITAYTQDLGRHLLLGKMIWQTFQVPHTNLLSYTYPEFPFLNHHYLSEVIYYLLKQILGDNGLLFFSVGLVLVACALVFYETLKKSSIIPVTIISILSLRILFERTDIRPEQFGYLFLSLSVVILYRFHDKISNWIWGLPIISFLWIQLHISFAIGLLVIGLFLLNASWTSYKTKSWSKTKRLLIVFFSCCLISLINPNGFAGFLYPLHIFDNYGYSIQENQTIFLLSQIAPTVSIFYFKIAVLLLFTSLFLTLKKTKPIDWLLCLTFTFLAGSAIRNFPLFVFATFLPFSHSLGIVYQKFLSMISPTSKPVMLAGSSISDSSINKKHLLRDSGYPKGTSFAEAALRQNDEDTNKKRNTITFLISCFLFLIILFQIYSITEIKPVGIGAAKGEENGVNFFMKNNLRGPLFNNFDIGSYLAYRLYPLEKVFIDGRPEAYPASFIQKTYIPMQEDQALFNKLSETYHFNTIFFSHTDQTPWANQFLKEILRNSSWKVVYLDDTSLILVKNNEANKRIIDKFGMNLDKLSISHLDENDFQSLLKLASFFNKTDLLSQEAPIDEKLLQLNPTYCPALYDLTVFQTQLKNQIRANFYQQQYLIYCRI